MSKNIDYRLMTGYDKRIYSGLRKSKADQIKDKKILENTVRKCLNVEIETELDDGSKVEVPIATMLIAKKINYLMEHPEKVDLKELSSVLNEQKLEIDASIKNANDLFGDIVNKNKDNDETE